MTSFLTDGQPEIAVFDKTLQIKQMHVLEMLDLLLTRVDKGESTCHLVKGALPCSRGSNSQLIGEALPVNL